MAVQRRTASKSNTPSDTIKRSSNKLVPLLAVLRVHPTASVTGVALWLVIGYVGR